MKNILVTFVIASTLISCASLSEIGGTPSTMVQGVHESVDDFTGVSERFVVVTYMPWFGDNYSISFHFDSDGSHEKILLGFQGSTWHFIDGALVNVDGTLYDLGKSLDNMRVAIAAQNVVETVLFEPNVEVIQAIQSGDTLSIRYKGSKGYKDVSFTDEQLELLKSNL